MSQHTGGIRFGFRIVGVVSALIVIVAVLVVFGA